MDFNVNQVAKATYDELEKINDSVRKAMMETMKFAEIKLQNSCPHNTLIELPLGETQCVTCKRTLGPRCSMFKDDVQVCDIREDEEDGKYKCIHCGTIYSYDECDEECTKCSCGGSDGCSCNTV